MRRFSLKQDLIASAMRFSLSKLRARFGWIDCMSPAVGAMQNLRVVKTPSFLSMRSDGAQVMWSRTTPTQHRSNGRWRSCWGAFLRESRHGVHARRHDLTDLVVSVMIRRSRKRRLGARGVACPGRRGLPRFRRTPVPTRSPPTPRGCTVRTTPSLSHSIRSMSEAKRRVRESGVSR